MNDFNMYDDPANWPISISQFFFFFFFYLRTNIVKLGPKRIIKLNFPSRVTISSSSEREVNRWFSTNFYYRKLTNGEIVDRNWLVFSISKDHVFCFCCKLFGLSVYGSLSGNGTNDWSHLGTKLVEHERSLTHFRCTEKWFYLKIRIQKMSENVLTAMDSKRQTVNRTLCADDDGHMNGVGSGRRALGSPGRPCVL